MSNSIHYCPNCSYLLVLLEYRRKFKCSKCGKLWNQREIESQTFQRWNKKMRESEEHNLELEEKQKRKLLEEKRVLKGLRCIFKEKRTKLSGEEREIKKLERNRIYYKKNRDKRLQYSKNWVRLNKEKRAQYLNEYRLKNLEKDNLKLRLNYWRQKQVKLAKQELRINGYNPNI